MKVLQINVNVNIGSVGRIAEEIGNVLISKGHDSYIAYARGTGKSTSKLIKIGSMLDVYTHGLYTLLTDKHGYASKNATKKLLAEISKIKPDMLVLHNLHGYYIHIGLLFDYIKANHIPVAWILYDCWDFTGHCTYFDDIACEKWKIHCNNCPKYKNYPAALVDNSYQNFELKRKNVDNLHHMELIVHSNWLRGLIKDSFLNRYKIHVTPSAINLSLFKPSPSVLDKQYNLQNKRVILGCASTWTNRKGYHDFIQLSEMISSQYQIVMIGLNKKEKKGLPNSIIGLSKTESIQELAQWYSLAYVFVNPTSQDNFPTTNLEALACGTPVITYNTGGSPEAIDEHTGFVVNKGNVAGIYEAVCRMEGMDYNQISKACRARAEKLFDRNTRYLDYLDIFNKLIKISID